MFRKWQEQYKKKQEKKPKKNAVISFLLQHSKDISKTLKNSSLSK